MKIIKSVYTYMKLLSSDPEIFNPNIIVNDISNINFNKLHSIGINYLVFDKDNTLTANQEFNLYSPTIEKAF